MTSGPDRKHVTRARIAEIKAALSLRKTIERLSGTRFQGSGARFKACCPFHSERTPSFFVDEVAGHYKCFGSGCGAHGDVIQFVADWKSLGFAEAVAEAAELAGIPLAKQDAGWSNARDELGARVWTGLIDARRKQVAPKVTFLPSSERLPPFPDEVVLPIPGDPMQVRDLEGERTFRIKPALVHVYRNVQGRPCCVVLRADKPSGGKYFLQTVWNAEAAREGRSGWALARIPKDVRKPIYGLEAIPDWSRNGGKKILIVEGEKAGDAAMQLLPAASSGILTLASMGGSGAVHLADWAPVVDEIGKRADEGKGPFLLHVWPDADPPLTGPAGTNVDRRLKFVGDVVRSFEDFASELYATAETLQYRRIEPPGNKISGWDLADALEEGWSTSDASEYIRSNAHNVGLDEILSSKSRSSVGDAMPAKTEFDSPGPE